ncbi:MAG: DNA mismatch repair protein MutS [Chloroflexi bacterium]|nr:DNA mismatch repair protein MutS [Chloroflexota bacterium]|tara:strand:- start:7206 stop:9794 length:2589 start_codon:yes stop_codon:yes gene_type:complete
MVTPARRQYLTIKNNYKEEILFFRMGDFYETFDSDAKLLSKELDIALTSREMGKGQRIPLAGIPYHSLETYLSILINKGYKVAICEQMSEPIKGKKIVDREVVRVVTPGTIIEDALLDITSNNYLVSIFIGKSEVGLSYIDITTGEFATSQFKSNELSYELSRINPSEILLIEGDSIDKTFQDKITFISNSNFDYLDSEKILLDHFGVSSLEAYGCADLDLAIISSAIIIDYINNTQKESLDTIKKLFTYSINSFMSIDHYTKKNLELFENFNENSNNEKSLYSILNRTQTPIGGRLLKKYLSFPLIDVDEIQKRQEIVTWLYTDSINRKAIIEILNDISDIERLMGKIKRFSATPRDLLSLSNSLKLAPKIKSLVLSSNIKSIFWLVNNILTKYKSEYLINNSINLNATNIIGDGRTIKPGFSPELDYIYNNSRNARDFISNLQNKERDKTGIRSLKVGYNKNFGYYIEISNSNIKLVPDHYIRKQTLVGAERFITPELKEYELLLLNAEEEIKKIELKLFKDICINVGEEYEEIMSLANSIGQIDVYSSFSAVALDYNYVCPDVNDSDLIDIKDSRHPVVEQLLSPGSYISNDIKISNRENRLLLLTGPNMSGKSTYIRQVAIIVLMAQIGCYVPAQYANIGIVDRIFTRAGLQDDITMGKSTFMVEMSESAMILNHATSKSLVILDEIGRGTSTFDGLSIATAVAEYLYESPELGCKTLFATHYHEMVKLTDKYPLVKNFHFAVSESDEDIIFLRNILPGGANKSYGINVAKLAGLPSKVIDRAKIILNLLESKAIELDTSRTQNNNCSSTTQLQLFDYSDQIIEGILDLDISSMTPLDAISKLYEIQDSINKYKSQDK